MAPSRFNLISLLPGTVVDARFRVEHQVGSDSIGTVYRATDSSTGHPVALNVLHVIASPEGMYRFNREVSRLSMLRHPGLASYVAHGSAVGNQPYLAMEWLEGETLFHRLARQPLSLSESLSLLRRAAEALSVAHQQGLAHRDIRPYTLWLREGRPGDVVVLDFGLARHVVPMLLSETGRLSLADPPGYVAPEMASSPSEFTPAMDIFALGCVLYECLTGKNPFAAPNFSVALAKMLFAEPEPLHTLRPGLPQGMQALVDQMLAKDRQRRLANADELLKALSALGSVSELLVPRAGKEPTPPSLTDELLVPRAGKEPNPWSLTYELLVPRAGKEPTPSSLTDAEQKHSSVLLVSLQVQVSGDAPEDSRREGALRDTLRSVLSSYSGQVELLANGALMATLRSERGTATDLAVHCTLAFKARWPEASVVLTTRQGSLDEYLPVGEAMNRAGRLLRQLEPIPSSSSVVMDEVTVGLLGHGFQLSRPPSDSFPLPGEQLAADASCPLLGKSTPCVGRKRELTLLDFTLNSCINEPAAQELLVTAPAGVGKSRLRHEFLRRLERREQSPLLLVGRGDPTSAGASCGLLGQVLRRLCGIVEGESLETRRARLYQRVARHLPDAQAQEAAGFLGELCAIPFPEEDSPRLRAARSDPRLMSAQMGRALVAFLRAECARQPVLLVLEDLHWSDALTVKLVEEALRELAEQPFMVLALARPEVKELFPGLWTRRLQELPLKGLSDNAGAQLVREVLGPQVPEDVVWRAVRQSGGNALFLEELIRRVAEGKEEREPETVLAVLQVRLMRMEPGGPSGAEGGQHLRQSSPSPVIEEPDDERRE
ncbi:serine/threonine-protein kinase [Vitiosangium sp. GDMCC 1.1324]|uniref:serine/threonine-protein kinase n=1 Tax=Vitiosangium sp. (strain GDMCC 1.1324) TaxID=2138576 RepID=UPI001E38E569|nr:serine/threonine-protein kinase [Vitiosangium sp. GDMCC 1.1324]